MSSSIKPTGPRPSDDTFIGKDGTDLKFKSRLTGQVFTISREMCKKRLAYRRENNLRCEETERALVS